MPQATDLVVDNGASTPVKKTFTLITPAAGDGGMANWFLKEGTISSVFPSFTAISTSQSNGKRRLSTKFKLPSSYTESVTGRTVVGSGAEFNAQTVIPADFPEALKDDFVAYAVNLYKTALLRSMVRDALPAT